MSRLCLCVQSLMQCRVSDESSSVPEARRAGATVVWCYLLALILTTEPDCRMCDHRLTVGLAAVFDAAVLSPQPQVKLEHPRLPRPKESSPAVASPARRSSAAATAAAAATTPSATPADGSQKKTPRPRSVYQRKDIKFPGVGRGNAPRAKRKAAAAAAAAASTAATVSGGPPALQVVVSFRSAV